MNILAFGASNSLNSINKKLASSISKYYKEHEDIIEVIDLNDYAMPIFSVDYELENGIPEQANQFASKIDWADFIIISFAENNGNYNACYKNITDWVSRIKNRKIYNNKPVFLLSTSPGMRGGQSVLEIATKRLPFDGADVIDSFSLPEFHKNFQDGKGITNILLRSQLESKVRNSKKYLKQKFEKKNDV